MLNHLSAGVRRPDVRPAARWGWEIYHNPEAGVYRSDSGVDARRSAGAEGFGLEAEM